jgi:hypothetical protein
MQVLHLPPRQKWSEEVEMVVICLLSGQEDRKFSGGDARGADIT